MYCNGHLAWYGMIPNGGESTALLHQMFYLTVWLFGSWRHADRRVVSSFAIIWTATENERCCRKREAQASSNVQARSKSISPSYPLLFFPKLYSELLDIYIALYSDRNLPVVILHCSNNFTSDMYKLTLTAFSLNPFADIDLWRNHLINLPASYAINYLN